MFFGDLRIKLKISFAEMEQLTLDKLHTLFDYAIAVSEKELADIENGGGKN
jgi:hypothetical protein